MYIKDITEADNGTESKYGTFVGRVPPCKGVIAFGATLSECEDELRSTLEDWIFIGLKLGHPLPV